MATSASNNTTSTMVGGYSKSHLLNRAGEFVSEKTKFTTILDDDAIQRMPQFDLAGKNQLSHYNTTKHYLSFFDAHLHSFIKSLLPISFNTHTHILQNLPLAES
jgi:hypothetical protein